MNILEIIDEQRKFIQNKEHLVRREILDKLIELLPLDQIISIVGVRRCGKSTLMKQLITHLLAKKITTEENIFYLNLENPYFNKFRDDVTYLAEIYKEFKKNVDKKKKVYVFFDEIQFFRDWPVFIKSLYEKKEAKMVITGSNSRLLSSELSTLLSGRSINLHLYPYSFREFSKAVSKASLSLYFQKGGFPEIAKIESKDQIRLLIETYYKNIIYQDVIPRFKIKNSLEMENLSYYLLSNVSKKMSYNTLKHISKLDDKTVKDYISYLEDANLLYSINNYDPSLKKQIGNKKKIYAVDTALPNFLGFQTSPNFGRIFENAVFIELKRHGEDIFFYSNSSECDFVLKKGYKIVECIQVTKSMDDENTRQREIQSLVNTLKRFKLDSGKIITEKEKEILNVDDLSIQVLPFSEWVKVTND